MTGSSKQRSEVWRGVRKKTSGGLTKADLIKNKRGKIVSKKKSVQAANQNNLGELLRTKGAKMKKSEIMHPKGKAAKPKPDSAKSQTILLRYYKYLFRFGTSSHNRKVTII